MLKKISINAKESRREWEKEWIKRGKKGKQDGRMKPNFINVNGLKSTKAKISSLDRTIPNYTKFFLQETPSLYKDTFS